MADYSREVLRVVVAQICQTIGWHSINSTPLEFMVDLMQEYFVRIYKLSHQYAEILGRTEVNLDDLGLAFQHLSIDLQQLSEYVRNVDSVPCAVPVPRFPLNRENHLNFLKPGSREVVTRPVHIHEYLPAMHPDLEDVKIEEIPEPIENEPPTTPGKNFPTPNSETSPSIHSSPETVFKRPGDPLSDSPGISKRTKINDESRALRELHSVMMTRAGFLSPAREGKLPESRTPDQGHPDSPTPSSYPMVPPELKIEKKPKKIVKKNLEDRKLDKENKKKNRDKDLFKPDKINEPKVKKLAGMKETAKLKALKPGGGKGPGPSPSTSPTFPVNVSQKDDSRKGPKNISPKVKPEKIPPPAPIKEEEAIDKLPSEPDKQKLNIFKKISKPRDDKSSDVIDQHKHKELIIRESSPIMTTNDQVDKIQRSDTETRREEKKVPNTPDVHMPNDADIVDLRSPSPDVYMFDDMSPPGTPSTPKTPELNVPGPAVDSKKKRKEKNNRKKDNLKSPNFRESPLKGKMMHDMMETEVLDRPKTPEALETPIHKEMNIPSTLPFPFFPTFPTAPGLIPHPIGHPMFPRFPLPLGPRGAPNPHVPPIMHNLPLTPRFMPPPMKMDDFPVPKMKPLDHVPTNIPEKMSSVDDLPKFDTEKIGKVNKIPKPEKFTVPPVVKAVTPRFDPFTSVGGPPQETPLQKLEKLERMDKKSKKHKIEKKEKLKKKKEKKDKHKEKPEKSKEKKEKIEKMKEKREKKDKRKEKEEKEAEAVPKITLKLGTASPRPPTPDNPLMKKITIKPLPKKPEGIVKRESSPELAKISPLVTRPPKQKTPKVKTEPVPKKDEPKDNGIRGALLEPPPATIVDRSGHQVWICPACGNQDDGSPMIGCDDCDAWYHWVCVGMQVPPADKEDWYCRFCIAKKQELHHDKKKKKRKKKVKLPV